MFRALCVSVLRKAADYLDNRGRERPLEIGVPVEGFDGTLTNEAQAMMVDRQVTLVPPPPDKPLEGSIEARVAAMRRR